MEIKIMWNRKYLCLWFVVLSACSISVNHRDLSVSQQATPLSQFLLGGWKGEDRIVENGVEFRDEFGVEFVDFKTLVFNAKTSHGEYYNEEYHYEIVGEDRIVISNKRVKTEWRVYRDAEELEILFPGKITYIAFKRFPKVEWLAVVIILAAIEGGLLWSIKRNDAGKDHKDTEVVSINSSQTQFGKSYGFAINILLTLFAFGAGLFLASAIILPPIYFLLRKPWYSVIQLEIGIIVITLGLRMAKNRLHAERFLLWNIKQVLFYVAVVLIGVGLGEIAIGMLRLVSGLVGTS